MLLRGHARLLFDQIAEIVGGQMQLLGAVRDCRRAEFRGAVRSEIAVQQRFEGGQRILVLLFAGDELPVVEADAVVEQ